MPYDHSQKAGNRGDVWKHSVLVELSHMIPAPTDTFRYVECHSGAPVHELIPGREWERGVGSVVQKGLHDCDYAAIAAEWLCSKRYPASWMFVVNGLAKRFKNVHVLLADLSDGVAANYPPKPELRIPPNVLVEFYQTDGFSLAANLAEADLVFLDPPFHPDADADWRAMAQACGHLTSRTIPFVAWYPLYWPTRPQRLVDTTACPAWEVWWTPCGNSPSQNLKGCGMLTSRNVVSLFDAFEAELRSVAAALHSELVIRREAAGQ